MQELKKIGVKGVMIGRAAVRNPAIFDLLKGKSIPTPDELKKEYSLLAEKYASTDRHKKNVLMRIGQEFSPNALGKDAWNKQNNYLLIRNLLTNLFANSTSDNRLVVKPS